MIQLATDPNASRSNWRPAPGEAKDMPMAARRARNGHAWPFIVRHTERGTSGSQDHKPTPSGESGS
jgi:hypothetical protein